MFLLLRDDQTNGSSSSNTQIRITQNNSHITEPMSTSKPISPFRLTSLLRSTKDPTLALELFLNPNPTTTTTTARPFRHSLRSYDLLITKLGRARMFPQMEQVLHHLQSQTRLPVPEPLLCHVIAFYARARLPSRALRTFLSIPSFRCTPTLKSFNSLLHALLECRDFPSLTRLLPRVTHFAAAGGPDACTYNILIRACSLNNNDIAHARKLFDEMRTRGIRPNQVTFGTLINMLCKDPHSNLPEAFRVKEDMERVFKMRPNVFVYTNLIKAVCEVGDFDRAFRMKDEMVRNNLRLDAVVYNTLVSALFKAGKKGLGFKVLEEMKSGGVKPDSVTCNVLIGEFCREGNLEEAYKVLDDGVEGVKPDIFGYNVVIGWLCKEGKWREASDLFQDMPRRRCVPDVVTYRTVFDGLCRWMQFEEAGLVLEEMIFKGYVPCSSSLNEFVGRLCKEGDFELLGKVLSGLGGGGFCNEGVWKTVVSLVCKSENLLGASELFDELVLA